MSTIQYSIWNPNGNITALVSTDIEPEKRVMVADAIMKKEPTVEQVGFLSAGNKDYDIQLDMAGDEFCGNATLCAACSVAKKEKVAVKVAGSDECVIASVARENNLFCATAKMPSPVRKQEIKLFYDNREYPAYLVDFDSIVHCVVTEMEDIPDIEKAIKQWCDDFYADALGIMFYNEKTNDLRPIVYVRKANTLFVENSCASGTTAIGYYLLSKGFKNTQKNIVQPGGCITAILDDQFVSLKENLQLKRETVIEI